LLVGACAYVLQKLIHIAIAKNIRNILHSI